jgi:hypothetical protein
MKRSGRRIMTAAAASTAIALTWSAIPATAGTGPAWHLATVIGLKQASNLFSVVANGPHSAWIFGSGVQNKPLTLHWNGSAWQRGTIPGVHALPRQASSTSADNVWAAGSECVGGPGSPPPTGYVARWNGQRWNTAVFRGNDWCGGSIVTAGYRNGWLFGNGPHAMHLAGTTWHQVSLGHVGSVSTATAISASDVWAFSYSDSSHRAFALNWNGHAWHHVALPAVKSTNPWASYSSADTGLWLSETTLPGPPYRHPMLLHRVGEHWQQVPVPAGNVIVSMSGDGSGGLWCVGWNPKSNTAYEFLHYAHGTWAAEPVPVAGLPGSPADVQPSLFDLAVVPGSTSAWATGESDFDNSSDQLVRYTVIYRYGG